MKYQVFKPHSELSVSVRVLFNGLLKCYQATGDRSSIDLNAILTFVLLAYF
jgi:hypothetical protein